MIMLHYVATLEKRVDSNSLLCSSIEYRKRILNGVYLEHNVYGDNGYGTPLQPASSALEHGDTVVLEIDYNGMAQVREYFRNRGISVTTVFICTEPKGLLARLRKRGDSPTEIKNGCQLPDRRQVMLVNMTV